MAESLLDLFIRTDLQHSVEIHEGKKCVCVTWYFRRIYQVPRGEMGRPQPTQEQLNGIRRALGAEELDEEDFTREVDVEGLILPHPSIRYTKRR